MSQPSSVSDGGPASSLTQVVKKNKSSAQLIGAKEALKEKLLDAVMQQAMEEVGSPDAIANQAFTKLGSESDVVQSPASRLRQLITSEIR